MTAPLDLNHDYLGHLISKTPLLHVTCMFAFGTEQGSRTSLRYFFSPVLSGNGEDIIFQVNLDIVLSDAGQFRQDEKMVFFLENVDHGFADFLNFGSAGVGVPANVSKGFDAGPAISQSHLHGKSVDPAELLSRTVNRTGAGNLALFFQVAESSPPGLPGLSGFPPDRPLFRLAGFCLSFFH